MLPASLVLTLLGGASAKVMTKMLLPADTPGGRCLDGSPAGIYFLAGDPKMFVIFLQGGGACYTEEDCKKRASTNLGTSTVWKPTFPTKAGTLLSDDCTENPGFCNATMVHVPYCSGDTHKGNHTEATAATWGLYFNGHSSFALIIAMLQASHGLGSATHVLLTGNSAGGVGTFANVDWLANVLPGAVVKGAPNAGWFFPGSLASDQPHHRQNPPSDWAHWSRNESGGVFNDTLDSIVDALWAPIVQPGCIESQVKAGLDPLACGSVHVFYKYIHSPLFVVENQYDTNQLYAQEGLPHQGPYDATWLSYVRMYGAAMRESTNQVLNLTSLGGVNYVDLVTDWFWDLGKLTDKYQQVEACNASFAGLPCNPARGCRVNSGPGPSPPGPAPSRTCLVAFRRDCLQSCKRGEACTDCAHKHAADLADAGCAQSDIDEVCEDAPCLIGLDKAGCLPGEEQERREGGSDGPSQCETCAEAHAAVLRTEGCTVALVQKICQMI
jgi:hypothetical protein